MDTGPSQTGDDELRWLLNMERRAPAVLVPGQAIGAAYRIERKLGAGGMGVVYLARDLQLRRDVAIKVHASPSATGRELLMREAATLAQLSHPNVVTVHEVGTWGDHAYVAMEYVAGGTARAWLAAAPRSPREILALYLAAGRGLAAAHAAGLVHRDFKPDNLLVAEDGRIRVADFGLARGSDDGAEPRFAAGSLEGAGTPAYMAPEQRARGAIGPAADQYALAVALWEALAGVRPDGDLRRPPRMPPHVHAALVRALAPAPSARFPSMTALLAELARDPAARRRRLGVAAIALVGVAAIAAGATWFASHRPAARAATCAVSDELDAIWNDPRRAALRAALPADAAARVITRLDAYAAAWTAQRTETCEATEVRHQQTSAERALRDACLGRRRDTLRAVVEVGEEAALAALDSLDDCADVARLAGAPALPDDPVARAAIATTRAAIDQARARYYAGRLAPALADAEVAMAQATQLGSPLVEGEALFWLGTIQMGLARDPAAARATLERAARRAAEAHDDRTTARAWLVVIKLASEVQHDLAAADQLVPVAAAAIARVAPAPELDAELSALLGELRRQQGRLADARIALEHAIAFLDGAGRPERLATPLHSLGRTLTALGDVDGGGAAYQRAVDVLTAAHGPDDLHLAPILSDLGWFHADAGRVAEGLVAIEHQLALEEAHFGPAHPQVAVTLANVAQLLLELHRDREALTHAERALAIVSSQPTADPDLASFVETRDAARAAVRRHRR